MYKDIKVGAGVGCHIGGVASGPKWPNSGPEGGGIKKIMKIKNPT